MSSASGLIVGVGGQPAEPVTHMAPPPAVPQVTAPPLGASSSSDAGQAATVANKEPPPGVDEFGTDLGWARDRFLFKTATTAQKHALWDDLRWSASEAIVTAKKPVRGRVGGEEKTHP